MKKLIQLAAWATLGLASQQAAAIDSDLLAGLKARAVGPAATSGRITDIEAVVSNPNIIYAGTATGGLWKSINAGLSWEPIFDDQEFASIGAIAIDQNNPSVIWVGTGEGNTRNSTSYGGGMFKSIDGGKTWKKIGLEGTERINRIALDPTNPNVAYVAALGTLWSENTDRGLYKTVDGGKSWKKVLYVDEKTGATDVKMDPSNPNKLYAAMWQFRRWPYRFESGGEGSGLYVSIDGGENWTRKTEEDGLPAGNLGRMVIAPSRSNPNRIYTLVEAKKSALIRSDDGGDTWTKVNTESGVADRPFYYSELEVDPNNDNIVYNIATRIRRSIDGGKTFSPIAQVNCCAAGNTIHIDNHTLWLNPNNSDHLILGNDGGIAITQDKADTWRYVQNLPVSQFYHIRVDDAHPYNIYGGLQDNGTWRGPAEVWNTGGIRSVHWQEIGFGDGFDAMPFPDNNEAGYAMSQGGNLVSWDLKTGEQKLIRPNPPLNDDGTEKELRFNWNAGLAQDPFDASTIYYGSQYVHKSTDRGASWQVISGDMTTDNKDWQRFKDSGGLTSDVTAAENFTSIVTIAPSTVKQGVIWVGTDDGRIHVTQDGGKTWKSIENKVRGVPKNTWVPHIEPSPHKADEAYVVFDNHRRGDMTSYVYKIESYGSRFRNIGDKNLRGYALSIQQDHVDPNLLFLGTELGLYVSTSGGEEWFKFTQGVPTVSVMDMAIQERENDLVLGTHGRSVIVIDDYSALRGLNDDSFKEPLALLSTTDGQQYTANRAPSTRFWGSGAFAGENEDFGVVLTVMASGDFLEHPDADKEKARSIKLRQEKAAKKDDKDESLEGKKDPSAKARVEVSDSNGQVVRTFITTLKQGVNRIVWPMNLDGARPLPGNEPKEDKDILPSGFIQALPGTYTFKVTLNDNEVIGTANVLQDPRYSLDSGALAERQKMMKEYLAMQNTVSDMIHALTDTKANIELVKSKAKVALEDVEDKEEHPLTKLNKQADEVLKLIKEQDKQIRTPSDAVGIVDSSFTLNSKMGRVAFFLGSHYGAPSATAKEFMKIARRHLDERVTAVNALLSDEVAKFNQAFESSNLNLLKSVDTVKTP
ncbi:hypothetical protein EYS14_23640 [Alteromonadaceae bacterium M269]|nr:hypothetical protein EYS14_23640 [Alteromonadaceae bacterium M269]